VALIILSLSSFTIAALLTYALIHRRWALAHPNARSLHSAPIPATGGLAIMAALIIVGGWWLMTHALMGVFWPLLLALALVAGISLLDDYRHQPAWLRLLCQISAAAALVWFGDFWPSQLTMPRGCIIDWPDSVGMIFGFFFILWFINLYNFMDGMDGFAGGMAVIGFGTFAVMGWELPLFATLNLIIAAAALGFLVFNFPPAKIFMGDVGATSLGLLAAVFSLWADRAGVFPLWLGILVFSPFIVDASATLLRRLLKREKIWQAHKSHAYQRLVQQGWGHKKTVLYAYVLMLACSASALLAMHTSSLITAFIAIAWVVIYAVLLEWIPDINAHDRTTA
jgi:UDP-N-acetylmuramyl pentapeptide phosphotransferase/UDP-N-acetylglucosamine-1-phosphate transferase